MILIPLDRFKALEKLSTDTPAKLAADVEFKFCGPMYEHDNPHEHET